MVHPLELIRCIKKNRNAYFVKNRNVKTKKSRPKVLAATHTPEPPPASNDEDLKIIPLNQKNRLVRKLELLGNRFVNVHITICCTRLQQPFFLVSLVHF